MRKDLSLWKRGRAEISVLFSLCCMKPLLSCLLLVLGAQTALPCINKSGTRFNGEAGGRLSSHAAGSLQRSLKYDPKPDGAQMEAELRDATDFGKRSDYAVALMYLGRSKEAVALLQYLEKEKAGEYFIAANLGTAYELSGNNEQALHWIREGIRRDPESHLGTEWLHAKILEAKIAQEKDADYFKKHSVLNLNPASIGQQSTIDVGDKHLKWKELTDALQYQLKERLQFVKPPDPCVAGLLFDYAAIEAARNTLESARELLQMALDFGYPPDQVQPLLKLYKHRIFWRETRDNAETAALWSLPILLIAFLIFRKFRGRSA
jgi:tetratricopeptide (TPR) repeat protein